MKNTFRRALGAGAALLLTTAPVLAGGIERANQSINIIFEQGNYAELSWARVNPTISGQDLDIYGGRATGNVARGYNAFSLAYKHQFTDQLSGAVIIDSPFGADISYPLGQSVMLGGTRAEVNSLNVTGILRWTNQSGFGAHVGARMSRADAEVDLNGLAYGMVSGYSARMSENTAWGWLAGVSYEIPDYAARVSLTYNSPITHKFSTRETGPLIDPDGPGPAPAMPLLNCEGTTEVSTPRSWNLDFQTGVAADTLVFGSIRWAKWSEFQVDPQCFTQITGGGLVNLEDSTTYTLGVGRKFNEQWSGSASIAWEKKGKDLVSPLAPTSGRTTLTLAGVYTQDNMKITTGISYTKLGDAKPETGTPDVARAQMSGNKAIGIGVRVGFSF